MPLHLGCLIERDCLPAGWMPFCVTKLVQLYYRETCPHIGIPLISLWHHWGDRTKAQQVFDWKMLWRCIYIYILKITFHLLQYCPAKNRILFSLMQGPTAITKNSELFVDHVSKTSVCCFLRQVSLGSRKCFHPAHFPVPVLYHLAPWLCGDPSPIPCSQNSLFNLEVPLSAASPCCSCET